MDSMLELCNAESVCWQGEKIPEGDGWLRATLDAVREQQRGNTEETGDSASDLWSRDGHPGTKGPPGDPV